MLSSRVSGQPAPAPGPSPQETVTAVLINALTLTGENEKGITELFSRLGVVPPPGPPEAPTTVAPTNLSDLALQLRNHARRVNDALVAVLQQV